MKTLYAVTSGDYSDYRVHLMTESHELALQCVEKLTRTDKYSYANTYDIQEMPLVESLNDMKRRTEYWVTIDDNGNEKHSGVELKYLWEIEETRPDDGYRLHAKSTRSAAAALKAARDRLARYKAEQAGIATR